MTISSKKLLFFILGACCCVSIVSFRFWKSSGDIQLPYFLDHEPFINPRIIDDLAAWNADVGDQIVEVDLDESQRTNRYYGHMSCAPCGENEKYPVVSAKTSDCLETQVTCSYQYIGETEDAIHIVVRKNEVIPEPTEPQVFSRFRCNGTCAKRLLTDFGFVEFSGLFWPIFDSFCGDCIRMLILSPQKESKIGSKEPENRQKRNPLTVSKSILFLEFTKDQKLEIREMSSSYHSDEEKRDRVLIRKVGEIPLHPQWEGKITLSGRTLSIGDMGQLHLDPRPHVRNVIPKTSMFLDKSPYINPKIIEDLFSWLSDCGDQVVAINLLDAQYASRFHTAHVGTTQGWEGWGDETSCSGFRPPFFQYEYSGQTEEAVQIVYTRDGGGGSGVFHTLLMVVFEKDLGMSVDWSKKRMCWDRERLLIKKLGEMGLGDRTWNEIDIKGNTLFVKTTTFYEGDADRERTFWLKR